MSKTSSRRQGLAIAAAAALAFATASTAAAAPILDGEFADDYTLLDLGAIEGLPTPYGSLMLLGGATDTLLIGGAADAADGALYTVRITRDADGRITGFSGPASVFAEAAHVDGDTLEVTADSVDTTLRDSQEGLVRIRAGNPAFGVDSVLVSEDRIGVVAAYDLDASGAPIVGTRRVFITELTCARGAFVDPVSGDVLLSISGDGDRVIAVRELDPVAPIPEPGSFVLYLLGLAGIGVVLRRRERRAAEAAAAAAKRS